MSAVSKSIRNTTGSPIFLSEVGLTIAAGDTYILTLDEYLRWANPDIITEATPFINSGDLVVNDGNIDLAAADGIRFLKYPDRAYIQKDDIDVTRVNSTLNFEGDVTVVDEGSGKATVTIGETGQFTGKIVDFVYFTSGNVSNKWMSFDGGGSTSSDELPLIMPQDGDLLSITFANRDDNVDIDVEVYKNGSLSFTWEVRNKRFAWKTDINGMLNFTQGDRVSIFLRKYASGTGDNTAQDPIIEVFFNLTGDVDIDTGIQYG